MKLQYKAKEIKWEAATIGKNYLSTTHHQMY